MKDDEFGWLKNWKEKTNLEVIGTILVIIFVLPIFLFWIFTIFWTEIYEWLCAFGMNLPYC